MTTDGHVYLFQFHDQPSARRRTSLPSPLEEEFGEEMKVAGSDSDSLFHEKEFFDVVHPSRGRQLVPVAETQGRWAEGV